MSLNFHARRKTGSESYENVKQQDLFFISSLLFNGTSSSIKKRKNTHLKRKMKLEFTMKLQDSLFR